MEKFNSFKGNLKNVVIGAAIVAASIIPDKANAGIFNKNKDKNDLNKTEKTSNKENIEQEKSDFKESNIGGIKYPFDKEYKTDKEFYRLVTFGKSMDQMTSIKIAMSNAKAEILKEIGSSQVNISGLKVLDQKQFLKDGIYITIIAVEALKENVANLSN